jgi:Bax protein
MKSPLPIRLAPFVIVLLAFAGCNGNATYRVKTKTVQVDSLAQIELLHDRFVKPILYKNIRGLEQLPFPEAKAKFISAILPAILVAKLKLSSTRDQLSRLRAKERWNRHDSAFFLQAKNIYKGKNLDDLHAKLLTLPNSIVLAQAAIETGWGESRFFIQASNLFGIWSFDASESRIAAGKNRKNRTIFLRSYDDMSTSITDYFEVLARASAYKSLRKARLQTSDPFLLIPHLKNYSERRNWYISQLRKVIRQNNLTQYDEYRLDPNYLVMD